MKRASAVALFPVVLLIATVVGQSPSNSFTTFVIPDRGGISLRTDGISPTVSVGYARVLPSPGSLTPAGIAIFGVRQNGVLVSEAGVPATSLIQSGRVFVEVSPAINTGIAVANPGALDATFNFYFTDETGADFGAGAVVVPAGQQLARFLDQDPFLAPGMRGTLTFSSSAPVSVVALRGRTNERGEFLVTTLPVSPLGSASAGLIRLPHFADGGGWTSQVVLINPTDSTLSGTVEFLSAGSASSPAQPVTVSVDGIGGASFPYMVPPRSARRLRTDGIGAGVTSGSVRVSPSGPAPVGLVLFSFANAGVTVAEAGVLATSGTAFRMFAELSGTYGQPGAIQTGLAMANPGPSPVIVNFDLTRLDDGSSVGTAAATVPPSGQVARFMNEIFPGVSTPFQGLIRVTCQSGTPISLVGLRGRYNERGDFLITTTPPSDESAPAVGSELVFPHIVDGGGFSTQFVLFSAGSGQTSNGVMQLASQTGQPLSVPLVPTGSKDWFVSPSGSPSGRGTITDPWDLQTALNHPSTVRAGDTINLRGGTYRYTRSTPPNFQGGEGLFTGRLRGTPANPIRVKPYGNERVILDGAIPQLQTKAYTILRTIGAYTWYMGFEITNSDPNGRNLTTPTRPGEPVCQPPFSPPFSCGESNRGDRRGNSLDSYGPGTKLINLVIYDTGQGVGLWDQATSGEAYGNIVFNNGWDASNDNFGQPSTTAGRLAGHGLYTQNSQGQKPIRDNIIFNNFGDGFHAAGSGSSSINGYLLDGNIHFNDRFLFTGPPITNIEVRNTYTYLSPLELGGNPTGNENIVVTDNYFFNPSGIGLINTQLSDIIFRRNIVTSDFQLAFYYPRNLNPAAYAVNNNTYYRMKTGNGGDFAYRFQGQPIQNITFDAWQKLHEAQSVIWDANSTYGSQPSRPDVIIRPNLYDPSRAHIIVYNYSRQASVTVDLSSLGMTVGQRFELRSAQNYFNDVTEFVYDGTPVSIPMTGRSIAAPLGYSIQSLGGSTLPRFGAFVVIKK